MSKFITVATFTYPQEAYVIKSRLEAEDIYCYLKNELAIQTDNFLSVAGGGVDLQIKEEDLEKALPLLEDAGLISREQVEATQKHIAKAKTDIQNVICPNCGSHNISKSGKPSSWYGMILLLFGIPIPIYKRQLHCFECYTDFKVQKHDR